MARQDVEVELRAVIRDDEVARQVLESCRSWATEASVAQTRFLVDYSTFLEGVENRTRDIRIRSTDGFREIIVKLGDFAAAGRREAAIAVAGSLEELATVMAFMGFDRGVAALRRIHRFKRGTQEIAFQEVLRFARPNHVYCSFVEAEQMASADQVEASISELVATLSEFGLAPMSEEEWYRFISELNREANGVFVHGESSLAALAKMGL